MKKLFLIATAMLLVIMVGFWSCEEENVNQKTETIPDSDLVIKQKIENFIAKTNDTNLAKSNETMCLDSAVWFTEAALNYLNCTSEFPVFNNSHQLEYTLPLIDGEISLNEVATVFQKMQADLQSLMEKENTTQFAIADIYVSTDNKSETEAVIGANLSIGTDAVEPPAGTCTYGVKDNWRPVGLAGRCDGAWAGLLDATTRLQGCLNLNVYPANVHVNYTFINVSTATEYPGGSCENGNLWTGFYDDCIGYVQMQTLLEDYYDIAQCMRQTYFPSDDPGRIICNYDVDYDFFVGNPTTTYVHIIRLSIGKKVYY